MAMILCVCGLGPEGGVCVSPMSILEICTVLGY